MNNDHDRAYHRAVAHELAKSYRQQSNSGIACAVLMVCSGVVNAVSAVMKDQPIFWAVAAFLFLMSGLWIWLAARYRRAARLVSE